MTRQTITPTREASEIDFLKGAYDAYLEASVPQTGGGRRRGSGMGGRARGDAARQSAGPADRQPDVSASRDDQGRQIRRADEDAGRHRRPARRDVLPAWLRR